tara:strand:+ start:1654 stop:1893 length:240 start_codon:yes stop_codon:yes gene_type:complete
MVDLTKLSTSSKIEVLITQVNVMQEKINYISDTVNKQSKDIDILKRRMNMGAGGIKAIALFGGILIGGTAILYKLLGLK